MDNNDLYENLTVVKLQRDIYGKFPKISEDSLDRTSYVYYLLSRGVCVYVGFSQNIDVRIATHEIDKSFDSIGVVPFKDKLNALDFESMEIMKLQPKYNGMAIKGWQSIENIVKAVNSRYIRVSGDDVIQCAQELGLNISRYKGRVMIEGSTIKLRTYMRKVK